MSSPDISVVAPVFNEEESITAFIEAVLATMDSQDRSFELVLVDDGSRDNTASEIEGWMDSREEIRLIRFSRNFGHQAAITAGVFEARGDAVVVMDSDLQDPPPVILEMLDRWADGADVVYAVRRERKGDSRFKRATASLYYKMLRRLSDTDIPADTGDFRLMSRRVVEDLRSMPERDRFMRGMVAWLGYSQQPVYFDRDPRFAGESKYPLGKMIRLGLAGVIGFSDKPLYIAISSGFAILGLAAIGLLYIVLSILFGWGEVVRGWSSVVVSVMFFSAVQLIFMGIIGLYISRIFVESKQRPLYIIEYDSLRS